MTLACAATCPIGKLFQRPFIIVAGVCEAHPSVCLRGDEDEFLVRAAFSAHQRLVHLHKRAERFSLLPRQRGAQFVQPAPRCFVGTEPHDALQILGRDARSAGRNLEHRAEPHLERLSRSSPISCRR